MGRHRRSPAPVSGPESARVTLTGCPPAPLLSARHFLSTFLYINSLDPQ